MSLAKKSAGLPWAHMPSRSMNDASLICPGSVDRSRSFGAATLNGFEKKEASLETSATRGDDKREGSEPMIGRDSSRDQFEIAELSTKRETAAIGFLRRV